MGERIPYTASARYREYVQVKKNGEPNKMWATKSFVMLGKCAEALALRKAFPDELGGMYSDEEMGQADNDSGSLSQSAKQPVQMPRSVDEKKPEPVKQSTPPVQQSAPQTAPQVEQISGQIEKASPGKGAQEGNLWLIVNKKMVCVPSKLIDADMVEGANILLTVVEQKGGTMQKWLATKVEMVVPPAQEGEVIDAEFSEVSSENPTEGTSYVEGLADDLFGAEEAAKKPASLDPPGKTGSVTRTGTIGEKRAKRLYAMINQNKKNTGFTDVELKKVLASLPVPLEHLSDLEIGMYSEFEKMATGEVDWKEYLS